MLQQRRALTCTSCMTPTGPCCSLFVHKGISGGRCQKLSCHTEKKDTQCSNPTLRGMINLCKHNHTHGLPHTHPFGRPYTWARWCRPCTAPTGPTHPGTRCRPGTREIPVCVYMRVCYCAGCCEGMCGCEFGCVASGRASGQSQVVVGAPYLLPQNSIRV
jgi:hypothetical protein